MLSYLRENTGNWIIKFFLGIIVIVFVFLGIGSFGSRRDNSVATINNESITRKEYQRAYEIFIDQMRARFGENLNNDILKALNIKHQVIDSLIDEKIVLSEAQKLGILVSDEELQKSLFLIEEFQQDGAFNLLQYKRVLSQNSLTPEIFENSQINIIKQQKVRNMLFGTIHVSDLEARNWYLFHNTETAVNYLMFKPSDYSDLKPEDKKVRDYYEENKNKYKSDLKIKVAYLEFLPEDYKDQISISDDVIKEYYQEHLQEYITPQKVEARHILIKLEEDAAKEKIAAAQKQALDIYEMAVNGQDFEKLAKKYSQGPSKEKGGYLGKFEKNAMVKPFSDKAFSMEKGEISKPVKTRFGWHIIQLVDKFEASTKTLEQISDSIIKKLENLEMQNLAYYKAGEAFDSVIDGDDLDQAALIAKKKIITSNEFAIDGKGLNVIDNKGFAKAAFELGVGEISDVKEFGNSYYLIKFIEKKAPVILEFDIVKDRIFDELKAQLQKNHAKKDAKSYLAKAFKANSLEQFENNDKFKIKSTKLFTRTGSIQEISDSQEFIEAGFSLNKDKKIYSEIIETSQGFYILGFKERKIPDEAQIIKNLKPLKPQILRNKQIQAYQAWISQLKEQSEITYNTQFLK